MSVPAFPLRPLERAPPLPSESWSDGEAVTEGAWQGLQGLPPGIRGDTVGASSPLRDGAPCLGAESRWLGEQVVDRLAAPGPEHLSVGGAGCRKLFTSSLSVNDAPGAA